MKHLIAKTMLLASLLPFSHPTFAAALIPYTEANASTIRQGEKPVVLAFHSHACGTCQRQKPILDALLQENELSTITAFRIDFDDDKALRKKFRVNSPSTILVLKNGQEIARSVGETDTDTLRHLLQKGMKS